MRELVFASHGRVLIGRLGNRDALGDLKFWDLQAGQEILSIPATANGDSVAYTKVSPDGETVAATTYSGSQAQIVLVDLRRRTSKVIELLSESYIEEPAFHPNGRLLAVPIQVVSGVKLARDTPATACRSRKST